MDVLDFVFAALGRELRGKTPQQLRHNAGEPEVSRTLALAAVKLHRFFARRSRVLMGFAPMTRVLDTILAGAAIGLPLFFTSDEVNKCQVFVEYGLIWRPTGAHVEVGSKDVSSPPADVSIDRIGDLLGCQLQGLKTISSDMEPRGPMES